MFTKRIHYTGAARNTGDFSVHVSRRQAAKAQKRLRIAQSHQSLRCRFTQSMEIDEDQGQPLGLYTEWP